MRTLLPAFLLMFGVSLSSCKGEGATTTTSAAAAETTPATPAAAAPATTAAATAPAAPAAAATAGEFTGKEVPILCYHQLRDWTEKDSKSARVYIMPLAEFRNEMKVLHDSGYTTILPDQLMDYLNGKGKLPAKPIMLTFDDATDEHYNIALPELEKYGFKGVFFIMTVVLNRPNYLTKDQVKEISDKGHLVASHTWDHHMTTKYKEEDWVTQIDKPSALLQKITGKEIKYFAYPFGLWNANAAQHIKDRGFTAAFQLAEKKSAELPMYTIRRVIADGNWNASRMMRAIHSDFKN